MEYGRNRRKSRKMLQGFGDFRPELGPLKRRVRQSMPVAAPQLLETSILDDDEDSDERCVRLREMAQELSLGLRRDGLVVTHSWYHRMFPDTFVSDDAVRWVSNVFKSQNAPSLKQKNENKTSGNENENAVVFLQELLDYGYIRRVSKRESSSSIGWEATEHVVRSKRRFKHTKHTLYRFDDELSEIQLRVNVLKAQVGEPGSSLLLAATKVKKPPKLFARLEFNGRIHETLAVKKSTEPEWQAHFIFGLDQGLASLQADSSFHFLTVSILQKNEPFAPKLLGLVRICVSDTKFVPRLLTTPSDAYAVSQAYIRSYNIQPISNTESSTAASTNNNQNSVNTTMIAKSSTTTPTHKTPTQDTHIVDTHTLDSRQGRMVIVRSPSMLMSSSTATSPRQIQSNQKAPTLDLSLCLIKTRESITQGSILLQDDALDEDGFFAPGTSPPLPKSIISPQATPRDSAASPNAKSFHRALFGRIFSHKWPGSPRAGNEISPSALTATKRTRRPSSITRTRLPSTKQSKFGTPNTNTSLKTPPVPTVQSNYVEKRGGPRHWRLCVLVEDCEGVRYDLAETYGLPWVMEVKVIVGATVAVTHAVERNRVAKGARWSERLTLDVFANRRVEEVKLVVCQRGRYDLMTRHVGALSLPLARVPVIAKEDQSWTIPPAEAHNLQRLKHGIVRSQHNGKLRVSVWLRDIRPLDPAPFGWKHLLMLDSVLLLIMIILARSLLYTFVLALLLSGPWLYLYRFEMRPSRILGLALTWIVKLTASLGLGLSFKHVAISAWVKHGRLHLAADVEQFAFSNPAGGAAGIDDIPLSIFSSEARRRYVLTMKVYIQKTWIARITEPAALLLARRSSRLARILSDTVCSIHWRYRQYAKIVTAMAHIFQYRVLHRLHFDDSPLLERHTEDTIMPDSNFSFMQQSVSTAQPSIYDDRITRNSIYQSHRRSSCDTTIGIVQPKQQAASSNQHLELSPHLLFPPRFVHRHFVSAAKVRVEVSACISSSWGLLRFFGQLIRPAAQGSHVWRGSPQRMSKLRTDPAFEVQCLGLLRIEKLLLEDVELNFCTSRRGKRRGEFCINSVVRRIADTKVAGALAKARRRRSRRQKTPAFLWKHLSALLSPFRQSYRESLAFANSKHDRHESAEGLYWPNTLEGVICLGNFPGTDDSTQFKVIVRARGVRLESTPQPGPVADWDLDFRMECDDASTVLHVAVYEIRTFPLGPKLVGQWVMTLKYLVTDPRYCSHTKLRVEEDPMSVIDDEGSSWYQSSRDKTNIELRTLKRWIHIDATLSDGQWIPIPAEIQLRLRWSYVPPSEVSLSTPGDSISAGSRPTISTAAPTISYPKALEQLRLNSEETRLRIGDAEAVRYMLSAFPFRLEMRKFQVLNLRFFAKDLFLGAEGEVARLQSRHHQPLSPLDHPSLQRLQAASGLLSPTSTTVSGKNKNAGAAGDFDGIRMAKLLLDGSLVAPIHQGGYDLADFARAGVSKLGNEILRSAPIMSAVYHIMPLLAGHVLWGSNKPDASSISSGSDVAGFSVFTTRSANEKATGTRNSQDNASTDPPPPEADERSIRNRIQPRSISFRNVSENIDSNGKTGSPRPSSLVKVFRMSRHTEDGGDGKDEVTFPHHNNHQLHSEDSF